ncbi:unnamed protein product [Lepidochelys kempii]
MLGLLPALPCLLLLSLPGPNDDGTMVLTTSSPIRGNRGFFIGAASMELQDCCFFAATENVIVASMNYPAGALGFLSLPPAAPGNAGLWDQCLVLRWPWVNGATFGGNPACMILFGQSAGASSVSFHLLSPGSRPLFAHAGLPSGAHAFPWAWISPEAAKKIGQALGRELGCPDFDDTALGGCLQGKELGDFGKRIMSMPGSVPTVDGSHRDSWRLGTASLHPSWPASRLTKAPT